MANRLPSLLHSVMLVGALVPACGGLVDDPSGSRNAPLDTQSPGPKGTGSTASALALATGQTARCMAQDRDHLYWMNEDGRVAGVDKNGGPVVTSVFTPPPSVMPIREGDIPGCQLVVEGGFAYATMYGLGKVARLSLSTNGTFEIGREASLLGKLLTPSSLSVDPTSIWVTELDSGLVKKIPIAGTKPTPTEDMGTVVGDGGGHPRDLVGDSDAIYWFDDGGLRKLAKHDGAIVTLTTSPGYRLALTSGVLSWTAWDRIVTLPVSGLAPKDVDWFDPAPADELVSCGSHSVTKSAASMVTATDGQELFVAGRMALYRIATPMDRGTVSPVFHQRTACSAPEYWVELLAVDSARAYWSSEGTIWARAR